MKKIFTIPFRLYKYLVSPWLGANCRFHPTCSEYAKEAIETHGIFKGGILSIYRLLRCNPFGGSGHDPVPPKKTVNDKH